jgi:coenzyme PQQ synthesis protein D (PqqD)
MDKLRLRRDNLSWRELDGEIVALDNGNSMYVATNRTGTLLWNKLAAGATREQLAADLVAAFDVAPDQAATDVGRFVDDLRAQGLLE